MGPVMFPFLSNRSILYSLLFPNTFWYICLFCLRINSGVEKEDYIKCEQIGTYHVLTFVVVSTLDDGGGVVGLLEHLESSGTNITIRGPIVRQL